MIVTAYRTMYRSSTSLLCGHSTETAYAWQVAVFSATFFFGHFTVGDSWGWRCAKSQKRPGHWLLLGLPDCESLCPLQGHNLTLERAAIHWVFGSGTGLWKDAYNRLEQFRYCFVVFEAAGVALSFQKHSLCNWIGMLWFHRSRRFFDLLEEYESNWDGFGSSVSILVIASYIWDVCEAYWLPLASMRDTPALWGQCLRILFDLWVFDLEVYFVTFVAVTFGWRLVIAVSELL